jgi:3-deoxy-D-manno-octulosonic-acid transferase
LPRLNALAALWAGAATVAAPGLRLALRVRQLRGKEMPGRLAERRGIDQTPRPPGRLIWLHAASVGETMSILPVLPALAEAAPDATILLTTGTVTSANLLAQRLQEPGLAHRVLHRFAPLDVPAWAARFLEHWRPDAAGFVESELWPNLLAACRARNIPVMLVNARLSERSLTQWRRVPGLARHVLGGLARVQSRSETDAERLRELGCRCVTTPGDLKVAAPPLPADQAELQRLQTLIAARPVWLAASTHPGEEALIFAVHRMLAPHHPGLLTIIAPRHPDRGAAIAAEAESTAVSLRSRGEAPPTEGVWIVDTLGELGLWYRLCGVAFVGRSLIPPGGGQNPLEPARLGCAIAVGPYTGNFTDHVAMLGASGGLTTVRHAADLASWVDGLLRDPARRQAMGDAASASLQRHGDLPQRTAAALLDLMSTVPA